MELETIEHCYAFKGYRITLKKIAAGCAVYITSKDNDLKASAMIGISTIDKAGEVAETMVEVLIKYKL